MNGVSKSCVHNNRLHNQAAATLSCLTLSAVGVFFFFNFFFSSPTLSPQHSALFGFVCVWCVRTRDEKLYELHSAKESSLPRPVFEKLSGSAGGNGDGGGDEWLRWSSSHFSLTNAIKTGGGWASGGGVALCKVGIIVGFDNPLSRRGEKNRE